MTRDKTMMIIHITQLKDGYYDVFTDEHYKVKRKDILAQIGEWVDAKLR